MSEGTKLWIFYISLRGPLLWELLCKYCKRGFIFTSGINRHIRLYQRNFYFLQEFVSKLFLDGTLTFRSFGSAELLFVESSPLCYVWQEFWSYSETKVLEWLWIMRWLSDPSGTDLTLGFTPSSPSFFSSPSKPIPPSSSLFLCPPLLSQCGTHLSFPN